MKESEARNKWCPHVRVLSDEGSHIIATVNRGSGLQAETNCIGSDCMMWDSWEYIVCETELINEGKGDCGLKAKDMS